MNRNRVSTDALVPIQSRLFLGLSSSKLQVGLFVGRHGRDPTIRRDHWSRLSSEHRVRRLPLSPLVLSHPLLFVISSSPSVHLPTRPDPLPTHYTVRRQETRFSFTHRNRNRHVKYQVDPRKHSDPDKTVTVFSMRTPLCDLGDPGTVLVLHQTNNLPSRVDHNRPCRVF